MKKYILAFVFLTWCSVSWGANIEAHYLMNDNLASTAVLDTTGNNNGTSARNTSLMSASGVINTALTFDGADDKIDCQSDFIGASACSIAVWIYPTGWGEGGGGTQGTIIRNTVIKFFINGTGDLVNFLGDGATAATSATNSIVLNAWTHIVVTRTATGVTNIYINGVISGIANQTSGTPAGGANILIGNKADSSGTFAGKMDDMRIYLKVISVSEIKAIYNGGAGTESEVVVATEISLSSRSGLEFTTGSQANLR